MSILRTVATPQPLAPRPMPSNSELVGTFSLLKRAAICRSDEPLAANANIRLMMAALVGSISLVRVSTLYR